MRLIVHTPLHAVIQLRPHATVPAWTAGKGFVSITRTATELSIICPESRVPPEFPAARGWTLIELEGPLDFGAVGILHALLTPLAQSGVPVLTMATHDTDFVLVRDAKCACSALAEAGYQVTWPSG